MNDLALSLRIGATLTGGFRTALGAARTRIGALGDAIRDVGAQRGMIERFESDRKALERSRADLAAASREVNALKLALRADPGNADLAARLEAARGEAEKLSGAVERQRARLLETERALRRAGLGARDLTEDYDRLGREMERARNRHERLTRAMSRRSAAGERLGELKGQAVGMAGAVYAAAKTIGEAIEFESKMADVGKVVAFTEPDGLAKMGATLKELSLTIPVAAGGLAEIAAAAGQLGVAAADIPEFTTTVAKMATAFDMGAGDAGDAMAKLANVYQIPITEMSKLGDAINHLSDNTAAKARDIVPVLARVGGTAKQFGLSAVQVAGLADAFIALGKPPEVAATAINAMLTKLQTADRQGRKFQEGLEAIGLSGKAMADAIAKDGQGALTGFLEKIAALDKQTRAGILTDLFGAEYSDDISLLTGAMDNYRKALSLVADESRYAGSMQREFENRAATTANQIQLAKNSVNVLAVNLGSALLPAVNAVLKPVSEFAGWAGRMAEKFPEVARVVTGVGVGLGVFVGGLMAAAAAQWVFNAALLANPIGITIAAVAGAAALIISNWGPISAFFKDVWTDIRVGAEVVSAGLKTAWAETAGTVIGGWTAVKDFFSGLWEWIRGLFETGVGEIMALMAGPLEMFTAVKETVGGAVGKTKEKAAGLWHSAKSGIGSLFGFGKSEPAAEPGAAVAETGRSGAAEPVETFSVGAAPRGRPSVTTVNAPITVNAAPGMSEDAVAEAVDRKLRERERAAGAARRGALHD